VAARNIPEIEVLVGVLGRASTGASYAATASRLTGHEILSIQEHHGSRCSRTLDSSDGGGNVVQLSGHDEPRLVFISAARRRRLPQAATRREAISDRTSAAALGMFVPGP